MVCTKLQELLIEERPHLRVEIKKHAWYLGEKLGREVSHDEAQLNYLTTHAVSYMTGFKDCYCTLVCSEKESCEEAKRIHAETEESSE